MPGPSGAARTPERTATATDRGKPKDELDDLLSSLRDEAEQDKRDTQQRVREVRNKKLL